jgi:hypothetical protein
MIVTPDGRSYRILVILDEFTSEALRICVDRKLNSTNVLDALTDLFILRGPRIHPLGQRPRVRRDGGPGLSRLRRCKDRRYRARLTLGKRLRRELQCAAQG